MSSTKQTLLYFWHQNLRHKALFFGTCSAWLTGMTLQKLLMPLIIAAAIDTLVSMPSYEDINYIDTFGLYFFWLVVLAIASQLLISWGLLLNAKLITRVYAHIQSSVYNQLLEQSLSFHNNTFSGSIVAQVKRFTSGYMNLTTTFTLFVLKTIANVFIAIIIIAFYSWQIALAMFVWTLGFTWLNIVLSRRRVKYSKAAAAEESKATAHIADSIGNMAAVKAFAAEETEEKTQQHILATFARKKYITWRKATANDMLFGFLMLILQLMVLVMSIVAITSGMMSIGILLLIQIYTAQLIAELWGLSTLSRSIEQSLSDAVELTETLNEKVTVTDPTHPRPLHVTKGEITFDTVAFAHDDAPDDTLFHDFSLQIAPGEKVGLVGHSGSGKTTLTKLLLRFSNIKKGEIRIDGQDIASVRQSDLRAHIAYVPQEPILFHRTLFENITYGKPDADEVAVRRAAKQAHALEFIEKLPKQFDTIVGERGIKLSGGQRQRIAIARAILKDAPILVLDEATSALDSESERLIQDALKHLMKNRTTIVIAHRLSTIQSLDRIVVLGDGKIIEQGTHRALLAQNGVYAELWQHQSGGFIEE